MHIFKIDTACAGQSLKLEKGSGGWFCIVADYGLVSFTTGTEVMFASGRMGEVIFDTVDSVNIDSQTVTLSGYGPVEMKHWEYFARVQ